MPTLVISAVNIVEGGMLKILQDCLSTTRGQLPGWRIVALVNNPQVVTTKGVEIITLPRAKTSWLRRVYTEYRIFRRISRELKADIWWSLHDLSPFVVAGSQFVYCHNPTPFYRVPLRQMWLEPGLLAFNLLYSLFYRINIRANRGVIVQQQWMRDEFEKRYRVRDVIVAHPVEATDPPQIRAGRDRPMIFVYPALSRAFKNFELIGEAARLLAAETDWHGRILLTIAHDETRLARDLFHHYGDIAGLEFVGRQSRDEMTTLYNNMDCLLFPSCLETWGLPITEVKALGKPMILADLPYAHETVGRYDYVRFCDPGDARKLADLMLAVHRDGWQSDPVHPVPIAAPFVENWPALVAMIVDMHERASGQGTGMGESQS